MGALYLPSPLIRSTFLQLSSKHPQRSTAAAICTLCFSQRPAAPQTTRIALGGSVVQRQVVPQIWQQRRNKSEEWAARQTKDPYTKAAKIAGMKSRAGWKLHELNHAHRLFRPGMTVVDLGYAPGSWTDVAVKSTSPNGRVLGVDIIPATPPNGASTIQGDFLDEAVQANIRRWLADPARGRTVASSSTSMMLRLNDMSTGGEGAGGKLGEDVGRDMVDVVISDMLMNVSGIRFKDHIGSMDLCVSALLFCIDVLKPGGTFVCKFYQGTHDKELEKGLKKVFRKVTREKPESSRPESREGYFVAIDMLGDVKKNDVLAVMPNLV
ncbi:FtsJ-like methyltransferase family protein [Peziza echinospora]|nr:FtsJ-like methyltransferase family protein [Peziza echinospora]